MELLIWLVIMIATYFIAENKNRSAVGWLVASLFFGVFALLLVLVLPKLKGGHYQ